MSDYSVFASTGFDSNEYVNAILAGEPYPPPADKKAQKSQTGTTTAKLTAAEPSTREDISIALSKLSFGIDDVSKQIKSLVNTHHEQLLSQASSTHDLSDSLTSVRSGLTGLDDSVEKLRLRIRVPYQTLQTNVTRLQKFQAASDVLRRTSRFVVLARRLQTQMSEVREGGDGSEQKDLDRTVPDMTVSLSADLQNEKERAIAKAALSIAELVSLLEGPQDSNGQQTELSEKSGNTEPGGRVDNIPLRSVKAVSSYIPFIEEARTDVSRQMETMIITGLQNLNQSLLASSLQIAHNLGVLAKLVQNLVLDLSQAVEERIRSTFDLSRISKEALAKDPASSSPQPSALYKSRVRTEPTNVTAPQWTAVLWSRLENMTEEMASCCVKVYTLEKVLKMKRDTASQRVFLDEAMKLLENKPSATFWTSLGRSLEKYARDASKGSVFIQQTLSNGYPRLLRLFHEFFAKIAVHTDTVYLPSQQSPETILILRSISNFESVYLSRSSTKLNEAVSQAFAGGSRAPPGVNEGINVARTVANELDSAKFDPLLVRSVAKNAVTSLEMTLARLESLASRDRASVTFVGPTASPQQVVNASLTSFLYHCWNRLTAVKTELSEHVVKILDPSIQNIRAAYEGLMDPVITAMRREIAAIISRLHRIDFSRSVDPMAMGGSSFYMKELVEKLAFFKSEILSRYNVGDENRSWLVVIVKFVIRTFVLHISIAKPLGESGKLQLTSDMTELEFALNAFMVDSTQSKRGGNLESVGDDYRLLRAMRPLLFLENSQLADPQNTVGLPPLITLHHILVRSPIPLPHSIHGWQEAEYVRWVDEHSEEEAWTLVDSAISHWEKISESEGTDTSGAEEYIQLARTLLSSISSAESPGR